MGPEGHPGEDDGYRRTSNRGTETHEQTSNGREHQMKTVMGWIDKIVSALARRKVDKDERHR